MRIAALFDIHGNLPALEAVLAEVSREGVDLVVVGGDVLPGPMPSESLSALHELSVPVRFIFGNGERDCLAIRDGQEPKRVPRRFHDALRWSANDLSTEQRAEIAAWPRTFELELSGLGRTLFCHATPRDENESFTRLTPERRLRPIFEATKASLVICGHTHMQFDRSIAGVRVVNAGSVGMPFGDPGAYWARLGPTLELRRTPYDWTAATDRIRSTSYPQASAFDLRHPPSESEMLELFEAAALR